jgi:hypothetical protein
MLPALSIAVCNCTLWHEGKAAKTLLRLALLYATPIIEQPQRNGNRSDKNDKKNLAFF